MPKFRPSTGTPRSISPSLEQYVEAIADLLTREKVCSVSQIAEQVQVSRPAASRAVRELSDQNLVEHRAYGYVDLTSRGRAMAKKLAARHEVLYHFLRDVLRFDERLADEEACRLEHQVDDRFIARLETLNEFFARDAKAATAIEKRMDARP